MLQYAIFDMDGTLTDSMGVWEEARRWHCHELPLGQFESTVASDYSCLNHPGKEHRNAAIRNI